MSKRIKTVPEPIRDYTPVIVTGNDYVSLPEIDEYGMIMSVTFLHEAQASLFEVRGNAPETAAQEIPFIMPFLEWNGMQIDLRRVRPKIELKWDWVPEFTWDLPGVPDGPIRLGLRIVAPPDEKGFCYILELDRPECQRYESMTTYTAGDDSAATHNSIELNRQDKTRTMTVQAKMGLVCTWGAGIFRVFTSRHISCTQSFRYDTWTQSVVAEAMGPLPLFGFSVNSSLGFDSIDIHDSSDDPCRVKVSADREFAPGDKVTCAYYVAFNREADGARTTGVHLKRVG